MVVEPIGQGDSIPSVRLTVWPDHAGTILSKGDFIAAKGKFTTNNAKGKTYYNLSVSDLWVGNPAPKTSDEVVNPVEEEDEPDDPGF